MTMRDWVSRRRAMWLAVAGATMALAAGGPALAQGPVPAADLPALIKAAQAEGEFTFYSAATENVASRVTKAFADKYGIKAQFLRLGSAALLQRYATEAESGKIVADIILSGGNSVPFARQGIAKGWIEPLSKAGIPAVTSGEFPKAFDRDVSAIVQVQLWQFAYNNEKVKAADAPKDWPDILNPKYKGEFILPDPASSDAYVDLWAALYAKYGDEFFKKLREQDPRLFPAGVPAMQSLAAGEGAVQAPVTAPQTKAIQDKGAPLTIVRPSYTTGVEMQLILTDRAKAKSPNAARLFANFLMSAEGNKLLNAEVGNVSVYDTTAFPPEYVSPDPGNAGRKDQIRKLLGL
ncbi:ABC transporter substrate-binding protein [Chelatococcus asaccharovorans]|uniref:ABC transporter substrate-binding protein n=1 Tax=Chelatococcus asaccharovorans TaxID=28210 RepID=UPI00224C65C6|nr:extracellular solute-binding protein [Chelatococcus asaccharovorans]CAH1660409.1 Iron(III) transport system substrate-binding protein [Chelatococcus asaccharovorans]CAH1683815.1 Iron(III) transport system substrate-binding protein [Chelatococcus asaccharovorans]